MIRWLSNFIKRILNGKDDKLKAQTIMPYDKTEEDTYNRQKTMLKEYVNSKPNVLTPNQKVAFEILPDDVINYPSKPSTSNNIARKNTIDVPPSDKYKKERVQNFINVLNDSGYLVTIDYYSNILYFNKPNEGTTSISLDKIQ
jgi:hypothetical protein